MGSDSRSTATIGVDFVAPAAARTAAGPIATIAFIRRRTSSAARPAISSAVPARTRYPIVRLVPSTNPLWRSAWWNGSKFCRKTGPSGAGRRTPTLTTFAAGGCAAAERGAAASPDTIAATKIRRFIP